MAWLRIGDTAAIHPLVLALHDPQEPMAGPAAWGFVMHLATLCAAQGTYDVAPGFITQAGGLAAPDLLKRAHRAGLLVHTGGTGKARRYQLVDDVPELLHIRLRAEIDWERQRRSDNGDPRLKAAVLLRDGDACRYCRRVCQPNDNLTARGRELDHLNPGTGARTPADLVVACKGCNGARGQAWQAGETLAQLAERFPLLPAPAERIFVQSTATWLTSQGHQLPTGARVVARADRDTAPTHTSRHPAGDQARPATQASAVAGPSTTPTGDQHPGTQPGVAAPDRAPGRAHPGTQPDVVPPSLQDDTHPGTQPGVAALQEHHQQEHHQHDQQDRPTADRSVTDRSGAAGPGRVGSGSGTGRVAGPPSRSSPDPPGSPDRPPPDPTRTRRSRRRPRAAADPWT